MINLFYFILALFLFMLPYFPLLLGNDAGFSLSYPHTSSFFTSFIWQSLFYVVIVLFLEFGWVYVAAIAAFFYLQKKNFFKKDYFLRYWLIISITSFPLMLFVSSKYYNDWAMKGSYVLYISLVFIIVIYLKEKWERILYFMPLILIGSATLFITLIPLLKPYIFFENDAYYVLNYVKNNLNKNMVLVAPENFYSSLIPVIAERVTIVAPLSIEANSVANESAFTDMNSKLTTFYTTDTESVFLFILSQFSDDYIFLVPNTNNNFIFFESSSDLKSIYSNFRYTLFVRNKLNSI